jgi:hypothetical protein
MIGRRGFITGLISLAAAPAIVRASSLMPVKRMAPNAMHFTVDGIHPFLSDWKIINAAIEYRGAITALPATMEIPQGEVFYIRTFMSKDEQFANARQCYAVPRPSPPSGFRYS